MLEETCSGGWGRCPGPRPPTRIDCAANGHSTCRRTRWCRGSAGRPRRLQAVPPPLLLEATALAVWRSARAPRCDPTVQHLPPAARDTIRADVYNYWLQRRKALGRPLMRRLQAPTPINDQNPYNVFR